MDIIIFLKEIYQNPSLFLTGLTAIYVVFTFGILRANQKIIRANLMPIFFSRVLVNKNSLEFELKNYSSYPAYDIDLWLIGTYEEGDVPYKSLLQKKYARKINIDFKNTIFKVDEFRFYGIIDHVVYSAFPPKNKCSFVPRFAKIPENISLVLQYKDATGKNYLYQAWLFGEGNDVLKLGSLRYSPLRTVGRIGYGYFQESIKELYKIVEFTNFLHFLRLWLGFILDKTRARLYLDKEIRDILRRVIFSGYQEKFKNDFHNVEDRGEFHQIN